MSAGKNIFKRLPSLGSRKCWRRWLWKVTSFLAMPWLQWWTLAILQLCHDSACWGPDLLETPPPHSHQLHLSLTEGFVLFLGIKVDELCQFSWYTCVTNMVELWGSWWRGVWVHPSMGCMEVDILQDRADAMVDTGTQLRWQAGWGGGRVCPPPAHCLPAHAHYWHERSALGKGEKNWAGKK